MSSYDTNNLDERIDALKEKIREDKSQVECMQNERRQLKALRKQKWQWVEALVTLQRYGMIILHNEELDNLKLWYSRLDDLYRFQFTLDEVEYSEQVGLDQYIEGESARRGRQYDVEWDDDSIVYTVYGYETLNGVDVKTFLAKELGEFEESETGDVGSYRKYRRSSSPDNVLVKLKSIKTITYADCASDNHEEKDLIEQYEMQFKPLLEAELQMQPQAKKQKTDA